MGSHRIREICLPPKQPPVEASLFYQTSSLEPDEDCVAFSLSKTLAVFTYLNNPVVNLQASILGCGPTVNYFGYKDSFTGRSILVVLWVKKTKA